MKKIHSLIVCALLGCLVYVVPAYSIAGLGIHWGFDFSLSMDDRFNEQMGTSQFDPVTMLDSLNEFQTILDSLNITMDTVKQLIMNNHQGNIFTTIPLTLSRSEWNTTYLNFGGKFFVDIIPFIDAVDLSFNIGFWEYRSVLKYPVSLRTGITKADIETFAATGNYENLFVMNQTALTIEQFDDMLTGAAFLKLLGLSQTPFTKVHFDLSVRKNIVAVPKVLKTFKLYAGGGASLHLATPVLTPAFVEKVVRTTVQSAHNDFEAFKKNFENGAQSAIMQQILQKLIDEGKEPVWGMHLLLGTMVKIPVVPIGFYADGKFMIPFGDFDETVDLGGRGLLLNMGITLSL